MDLHILIVEDEQIIAIDTRSILENLGYKVTAIVSSGEKTLEKLKECHVDLVLMDIKIKGDLDGIETTKMISEQFDIPVIYMSAYADQTTLELAKNTDVYGFIVKPVSRKQLQSTIEMALFKYRMNQKH